MHDGVRYKYMAFLVVIISISFLWGGGFILPWTNKTAIVNEGLIYYFKYYLSQCSSYINSPEVIDIQNIHS